MAKRAARIKNLARAAKITKGIFAVVSKGIKPGACEKDIARAIETLIKQKGLRRSFRTIVASGPNAARPHVKVTKRKIKANDVVVVDFGVIYRGYRSDMTRTVIVGKIDAKMRNLYSAVKTAQQAAIRRLRPGLRISDLVRGVHDSFRKKGLGKYILHSLGHGVGKKIHEAPKLSEKNRRRLARGAVITIEPGLYIAKKGGVRIEDMVYLSEKGARVLTR